MSEPIMELVDAALLAVGWKANVIARAAIEREVAALRAEAEAGSPRALSESRQHVRQLQGEVVALRERAERAERADGLREIAERAQARAEQRIADLEAKCGALMAEKESTCGWCEDGEDSDVYQSECGMTWQFNDGGPAENHMTYCHGCGKRIDI